MTADVAHLRNMAIAVGAEAISAQTAANLIDEAANRIADLEAALKEMTANFKCSLLLVSDEKTRKLGMDLVRDAQRLLRPH